MGSAAATVAHVTHGAALSPRRLDIQGLRATAVLMVIAFHAGLPVPGGFVGVDVFFVISGFVITGMLWREWSETGRIRFGRFYLKRFKRLAPALGLMVAVTLLISALVLSPLGPQQIAVETGIGAMFGVANIVIAKTTGGYFDVPAERNPLLNTWSLSVEEQFYLVFPLLIVLTWFIASRRGALRFSPVLVTGVVIVLSFSLALAGNYSTTSWSSNAILGFYSPFTRAWEFAAGALLAIALVKLNIANLRISNVFGSVGLGLLITSLWAIDETTPFPGLWTLVPVTGTLLLLAAGSGTRGLATRALSALPMVKIGDYSYSLYLWHWPLIVFAVYLWPESTVMAPVAAAVAVLPAILSYKLVEVPLRNRRSVARAGTVSLVMVVCLSPVFIAGVVDVVARHYWIPKYMAGQNTIYEGDIGDTAFFSHLERNFFPCEPKDIRQLVDNWEFLRCYQSQATGPIQLALVGDSHAEHLFPGLAEALPETNIVYYIGAIGDMPEVISHVSDDPEIKTVVVSAWWRERGVPLEELARDLKSLTSRGKSVFITDDVPDFPFDPEQCRNRKGPVISSTNCKIDKTAQGARHTSVLNDLRLLVMDNSGVDLLETNKYFCYGDICSMTIGDEILFRDGNHLNISGSRFVAEKIVEDEGFAGATIPWLGNESVQLRR